MTTSTPPLPTSGSRPFIIAMILMLLMVAGLIVYKCSSSAEKVAEQPPELITPAATPTCSSCAAML